MREQKKHYRLGLFVIGSLALCTLLLIGLGAGKWFTPTVKLETYFDESVQGIDVGSKSEIHKLMTQFAQQGLAIIMISSELPEILGMSDRVIVMHEGGVRGEIERKDASQENIMALATGGKQ